MKIPTFRENNNTSVPNLAIPSVSAPPSVARGLNDLNNAMSAISSSMYQREERNNRLTANKYINEFQGEVERSRSNFNAGYDRQYKYKEDGTVNEEYGSDYSKRYINFVKETRDKYLEDIEDESIRDMFQIGTSNSMLNETRYAATTQANNRMEASSAIFNNIISSKSNILYHNPSRLHEEIGSLNDMFKSNDFGLGVSEDVARGYRSKLAISALESEMVTNPQNVLRKINDGEFDPYLDGDVLAKYKARVVSAVGTSNSASTYNLKKQMEVSIYNALQGNTDDTINPESVLHALGEDAYNQYKFELGVARTVGDFRIDNENGTLVDLAKNAGKLIYTTSGDVPTIEDAARLEVSRKVMEFMEDSVNAFQDDPGAYTAKVPVIVNKRAEWESLMESGSPDADLARQQYFNAVADYQMKSGLNQYDVALLSNAEVENLAKNFNNADVDTIHNVINSIGTLYGEYADDVMRQVANNSETLSSEYAHLIGFRNTFAFDELIVAARSSTSDIQQTLPSEVKVSDIRNTVNEEISEYIEAYIDSGMSPEEASSLVSLLTKAAAMRAKRTGDIEEATKGVIEQAMTNVQVEDGLWMPSSINAKLAIKGLRKSTEGLKDFNPRPLGADFSQFPSGIVRENFHEYVADNHFWVSSEDGKRAIMVISISPNMPPIPVMNDNFDMYEVEYTDAEERGKRTDGVFGIGMVHAADTNTANMVFPGIDNGIN